MTHLTRMDLVAVAQIGDYLQESGQLTRHISDLAGRNKTSKSVWAPMWVHNWHGQFNENLSKIGNKNKNNKGWYSAVYHEWGPRLNPKLKAKKKKIKKQINCSILTEEDNDGRKKNELKRRVCIGRERNERWGERLCHSALINLFPS